jgi:hypothetical protein
MDHLGSGQVRYSNSYCKLKINFSTKFYKIAFVCGGWGGWGCMQAPVDIILLPTVGIRKPFIHLPNFDFWTIVYSKGLPSFNHSKFRQICPDFKWLCSNSKITIWIPNLLGIQIILFFFHWHGSSVLRIRHDVEQNTELYIWTVKLVQHSNGWFQLVLDI